jgi:glycerate kinase
MHILIAPNAFKNSLSASDAARSIALGLHKSRLSCETICFGIGDGGDGTGHLFSEHKGGKWVDATIHDPLGRQIESGFFLVDDEKTAVIELADASGLHLLKPDEYDPLLASSYGTGELIRMALNSRVQTIILCIGGSATVDGGIGILQALGLQFLDADNKPISDLPRSLEKLHSIKTETTDNRILNTRLIILCDVANTLLGRKGARVFSDRKKEQITQR